MLNDGAEILDIGGESTRPGAGAVTEQEEVRRVVPAITAIKNAFRTALFRLIRIMRLRRRKPLTPEPILLTMLRR